ncbi:MAG: helix-turn-helix domain-containing protein [Oscillospiraceae bacterium]|nr:helix-turn-helix domain-containing protein [Oscillospiraceae bacterium]
MPVNEYEEMSSAVCRMQYLDKYQAQIMGWLVEFPDMTAAQVYDWLKEHYREEISGRTVSRYVKQLREECSIFLTSMLFYYICYFIAVPPAAASGPGCADTVPAPHGNQFCKSRPQEL